MADRSRAPRLARPHFDPSYGISNDPPEGLSWADVEVKLAASRNYWVCTTRTNGAPHSKPVWGVWTDGALWFGTGDNSVAGRNLVRDPRISVHLESGDDTVILEGTVERFALSDVPRAAQDAYAAKYAMATEDAGDDNSPWFSLRPTVALTWLETDFVKSAARWEFDD